MDFHVRLPLILCLLAPFAWSADDDAHLSNLLDAVNSALYSGASLDNLYRRPQDFHYSSSNGISLGVYEALLSITQNDDLECVPRLLCEAAAGGRPGYSGRDIKFDKASLTKFISYLNLGPAKSSPLLTFARAALLGASNRGDPYACIINYAKCPKDQSRLLHYLNNHRGGFFQYFDRRDHNNNQYQNQYYRPNQYNKYRREPIKYKKNRIKFEHTNFYNNLKKKAISEGGVYATKYSHSSLKFPSVQSSGDRESHRTGNSSRKRMVFPAGEGDRGGRRIRGYLKVGDPRILNQSEKESFFKVSLDDYKNPKKGKASSGFFPEEGGDGYGFGNRYASQATDRLPSLINAPQADDQEGTGEYENYENENGPLDYNEYNSFFPK